MKKILIVDDSPFFRRLLKDVLSINDVLGSTSEQLQIFEADDKQSALDQIQKHNPALLLLDIVMRDNEREGVQILEAVREHYPKIKVIIVTSVGQNAIINKCKGLGVDDYIGKPFDNEELISAIKKNLLEDR